MCLIKFTLMITLIPNNLDVPNGNPLVEHVQLNNKNFTNKNRPMLYLVRSLHIYSLSYQEGGYAMEAKELIICRCEEVTLADITDTIQKYQCSSREAKLRTRAGMGYCGGRVCRALVDIAIAEINGEKPTDDIPLSYRPPIRPVPFYTLGGE